MSYVVLARRYRPQTFEDIVGQEPIVTTLRNAIRTNRVAHAYLLAGPRGVGKTSAARILSKALNCQHGPTETPCNVCDICRCISEGNDIDVLEIDGASNRGIDEVRNIRQNVSYAPSRTRYKIYIIDEVHMLTRKAFNALLKTLEEPPAHVKFIFATTEAHKLPETIVSRTQRFTFKPVDHNQVVDHLRTIAQAESITISDDALTLVAAHGEGSFRDSISLLDQVKNQGEQVDLSTVEAVLGIASEQTVLTITGAVETGNIQKLVETLHTAQNSGYQAGILAKQVAVQLRDGLVTGSNSLPHSVITDLLQKLLSVPAAHDQSSALELALIEGALTQANQQAPTIPPKESKKEQPTENVPATEPTEPTQAVKPILEEPKTPVVEPQKTKSPTTKSDIPAPKTTQAKETNNATGEELWEQVLQNIKAKHNTLYSVARMADAHLHKDTLTLTLGFAFHQKRLNETKNKQILADLASSFAGKPISVECTLNKDSSAVKPKAAVVSPPVAATIS